MMLGTWGNPDQDESVAIIRRALDARINFVDTGDVYSVGESEDIVAKALAGRRDDVVLATKAHFSMGGPNCRGTCRRRLMQEVDNGLRWLGTGWIDLYQVHRPDGSTDIDDMLGALTDLVRAGRILQHPAVTSAIISPRTTEEPESQLGAADVVLDDDLLDPDNVNFMAGNLTCRRDRAARADTQHR